MKKIIIGLSLVALSSMAAAQTALTQGGKTALQQAQCGLIASTETANVQLSKDVVGSYACTATNAGIGTAHPSGKGKSFGASSNGGKLAEVGTAEFANTAAAQTAAGTAATTARDAS